MIHNYPFRHLIPASAVLLAERDGNAPSPHPEAVVVNRFYFSEGGRLAALLIS
jgi:hypothetical protein